MGRIGNTHLEPRSVVTSRWFQNPACMNEMNLLFNRYNYVNPNITTVPPPVNQAYPLARKSTTPV